MSDPVAVPAVTAPDAPPPATAPAPAPVPPPVGGLTKLLIALHLKDPASLKRALALFGALASIVGLKVGMPNVTDAELALVAGLFATYIGQSGVNSAAEKMGGQ